MECQFVSAGSTNDTTKHHHILAAIPKDVATNQSMEIEGNSSLKDIITQVYQKSKKELIDEALGSISLDGQKRSVCLLRNQRKLSESHLIPVSCPKCCRFHLFFANSAKNCKLWCERPGPKPTHIEPSSRAPSPATYGNKSSHSCARQ